MHTAHLERLARPGSPAFLELVCNGAPAIVAVAAALAAARRRRRDLAVRSAVAQVLHLPRRSSDRGMRRAA
jgi:hypothetical protein